MGTLGGKMRKILIVDDAPINRELLKIIFEEDFDIIEAGNGVEAIEKLDEYKDELCLIFLDLIMPEKSGIDVLSHMKETGESEHIPVIMITGEATTESDAMAYELGAADIIYKPFARRVVTRRALNIIELYDTRNNMEKELEERTKELKKTMQHLEDAHVRLKKNNDFLVNALSSVVEFRSLESGEHVKSVQKLTYIILHKWVEMHPECHYTEMDITQMANAAALHDIGKIAIPDNILLKPGKLTREEFEIMKTHTIKGCEILERFKQEDSDYYRYCYDICRYHHERYDGKGYPDGLAGDEIPLWAQIVSVVDVYDALVSPRVYKAAFSVDEAFRMIYDGECGTFNPAVLECLKEARPEIVEYTARKSQ